MELEKSLEALRSRLAQRYIIANCPLKVALLPTEPIKDRRIVLGLPLYLLQYGVLLILALPFLRLFDTAVSIEVVVAWIA
jgi:hypothetical protein